MVLCVKKVDVYVAVIGGVFFVSCSLAASLPAKNYHASGTSCEVLPGRETQWFSMMPPAHGEFASGFPEPPPC